MNGAVSIKVWLERDGQLLRLRLARPKANVIDAAMTAALSRALDDHAGLRGLKAVLIDAEGPNFSFGASVEEHLPARCAEMLRRFHALIRRIVDCPIPVLAAIRGRCLGGGLELAAACHLLFASHEAALGQPEIQLGVIAPAASCLLPERIARAHAEDILLSGRSLRGEEAALIGLVNACAPDPEQAALAYFDRELGPKSASSLRFAVRAARADLTARIAAKLETVETMYLKELMPTRDATEGLEAFIAKRPARWENR
jgi:cyclohexa-1,5-dienecarbonyl-CoA hydratase